MADDPPTKDIGHSGLLGYEPTPPPFPAKKRLACFLKCGLLLCAAHYVVVLLLARERGSDWEVQLARMLSQPVYAIWKPLAPRGAYPPEAAKLLNSALWGFVFAAPLCAWRTRQGRPTPR